MHGVESLSLISTSHLPADKESTENRRFFFFPLICNLREWNQFVLCCKKEYVYIAHMLLRT